MRITSQMNQSRNISYLTNNYSSYVKYENQVFAQSTVLGLSDNPVAAINGIKMTTTITRTEQYVKNITSATSSLNLVDSHLGSIKTMMDEMNQLIIDASSSTATAGERSAMATELKDMLSQLLLSANATDGERYLFGGSASTSAPYTTQGGDVLYNGNNDVISVSTGQNSTTAISCSGSSAFGNSTTSMSTGDLSARVNLGTDVSTSLSALNGGSGIPKGKIVISYSAYPDGLEIDLSGCTTLEDVKDTIEKATLDASRNLSPSTCSWLDGSTLDWQDMTDRYVKVTQNPDGTGISLQEYDLGETLPEPTAEERKKGLTYSGAPGYNAGEAGVAEGIGGATTVHDKTDAAGSRFALLAVDDHAGSGVATALGINGTAASFDPATPDAVLDGFLHGRDLNPAITKSTLLADLDGYGDGVYTITNGSKTSAVTIRETSADSSGVFSNWDMANLSTGYNCGMNGELYAKVTRRGTAPDDELYVEVYAVPLDRAKAGDMVASGTCGSDGGTVQLTEANGSGISGSVGIVLGGNVDSAQVNLQADFGDGYQGVVNVPAFVEEADADGVSLDVMNILSGWNITGLDKPPAEEFDLNHPATTDLDGNVTVRLFEETDAAGATHLRLELYRPAYGDQPEELIATGTMPLDGQTPLATAQSGRIAITGVEGYECVGGSVYVELPADEDFDSLSYNLTATFATVEDLMRAVEEAGVYAGLDISEDGSSLEFTSKLAGAYLTVSHDADSYERMNDIYEQLSGLDLNGLVAGVNADSNGNVHVEVAYYPPSEGRTDGKALLIAEDGTQTLIDSGYYVRVYSDADALSASYENRDNSSLVAEGFIASGGAVEGMADNLVLVEKNGSGLSGTVNLNYYGGRPVDTSVAEYNNSGIRVVPGGIRPEGSLHTVMQEVDMAGFVPGVHSDYSGTAYGTVSSNGDDTTVCLYKDSSRSHMTAKGELTDASTGLVTLYETTKNGDYALDANGERIQVGTMTIASNTLSAAGQDTFTMSTGSAGVSGQARESNIFSTIYDAIEAMNANDVEALHNLVDVFASDIDRLLEARATVSSRSARLEMLSDRYSEDILSYTAIYESEVGMDTNALAATILNYTAAQKAYNASLQVAGQYMQMSLLDYL
ncbi:MAG: flagellar hook-associated protein FlgL [Planctomycetes bacterium]|nr:flagellar hook-associated protein FlgL [Planctomycetota bacterium]